MRKPELITRRLSDVEPESFSWLWQGIIPMGKLSLIMGHPGQGKGLLTLDLAARVTTGQPWPGGIETRKPRSVVLLTPEDDPADTIRPRLDVAGADVSRVHVVTAVKAGADGKQARSFSLADDVEQLKETVKRLEDCGLIIIDPISAYFGTDMDSHKDTHVRCLMMPLVEIAAETGVAIICVSHMNKGQGPAINRGMGSMGFIAISRTAFMLGKSPDNNDVRVLCPIKCNIAKDSVSFAFRVVEKMHPSLHLTQPAIEWLEGNLDMTADDFFALSEASDQPSKLAEAEEFLKERLSEEPVLARTLTEEAHSRGISERTLKRAQKALNIQSEKQIGVENGSWMWSLPVPKGADSSP